MKQISFSAHDQNHIVMVEEPQAGEAYEPRTLTVFGATATIEVLAPSPKHDAPWHRLFVVATRIDKLPGRHLLWAFGISPAFDCPIPDWPVSYRLSQATDYRTHSAVLTLTVPDETIVEL